MNTIHIPTLPMITHTSSTGSSGPWTESDTKITIAIWIAFIFMGLMGLLVEYIRYKRSDTDDSFIDFLEKNESLFGLVTIWSSVLVSGIYLLGLLIYGIYSIL